MACFLVPAAEAVVTTVVTKIADSKESAEMQHSDTEAAAVNVEIKGKKEKNCSHCRDYCIDHRDRGGRIRILRKLQKEQRGRRGSAACRSDEAGGGNASVGIGF